MWSFKPVFYKYFFFFIGSEEGGGGGEGRVEQRRGLRMKALMLDLGTRLECRQRVLVSEELEEHCGSKSIVPQPDFEPATLGSIAHDYPTAPSLHHGKINRFLYHYHHYM